MFTNVYTLQEPFSVGQKDITISDDPDLVGVAAVEEDVGVAGAA